MTVVGHTDYFVKQQVFGLAQISLSRVSGPAAVQVPVAANNDCQGWKDFSPRAKVSLTRIGPCQLTYGKVRR